MTLRITSYPLKKFRLRMRVLSFIFANTRNILSFWRNLYDYKYLEVKYFKVQSTILSLPSLSYSRLDLRKVITRSLFVRPRTSKAFAADYPQENPSLTSAGSISDLKHFSFIVCARSFCGVYGIDSHEGGRGWARKFFT